MHNKIKTALVLGAGGFIGTHLVTSLKKLGWYVIGADLKHNEFRSSDADEFYLVDLRDSKSVQDIMSPKINTVYQLAADMGGAGYIFAGHSDADIMSNSAMINLNVVSGMRQAKIRDVFFTSSACVYPCHNQMEVENLVIDEESVYPANPDSEYGWEKLFAERLYLSFARNYHIRVRIARLHNVFGPYGVYNNGREKVPAAICRKVIECDDGEIEIWGDGNQHRSFLYIDQCIEGIHRIHSCDHALPLNLGSTTMISINELVDLVASVANKSIRIKSVSGPIGVQARVSDNRMLKHFVKWQPVENLRYGLAETYAWMNNEINNSRS